MARITRIKHQRIKHDILSEYGAFIRDIRGGIP